MKRLNGLHTVVVVDDDPAVRRAIWRALQPEPYQVLITGRPSEALRWVRTHSISLVISDQRMPQMEGVDLLEEVGKKSPSTARMILTAYPESTTIVPGLRKRIDCLVTKPWDTTLLRRTIRDLLSLVEEEEDNVAAGQGCR